MKWKWPYDFKLLSSKDPDIHFVNMTCETLRDSNFFQNAKFFCWKSQKAPIPLLISDIKEDGMECEGLHEVGDFTYLTKYLCMSPELSSKLQLQWSYIKFRGFDHTKCIGFEAFNLIGDMWANNYLCGKASTITETVCI